MTFRQLCLAAWRRALRLYLPVGLILTWPSLSWAAATGPFGTALPDGGVPGMTFFPRLAAAFISMQFYFNQHMTAAIRAFRHDGSAMWTLLGLSFAYGVVHAAGPGHGKAVVSSYLLATRQTLRNGIALAFIASLAQAAGAIALIVVASLVLHMTSVSMTLAAFNLEIVSGILVVLLGCWLVWSKIIQPARARYFSFDHVDSMTALEGFSGSTTPSAGQLKFQARDANSATVSAFGSYISTGVAPHDHDHNDCNCGHAHMPDARAAAGSLDWRKAWTIVMSTALRPCTGALIVLVFSISQGLWLAGIVATFVMGLGTAITVSSLAVLAVSAHKTAFTLVRADGPLGRKIIRAVEASGAVAVLLFGILLVVTSILLN